MVVVPGFTEVREIGRGGFATVYAARSEADGSVVALKVFRAEDVDGRRVRRELAALERLSGIPNVVAVLDVTTAADGSPVMVMPYLPATMAARVAEGGVDPALAVRWLSEIAIALDQATLLGVHHRDIKPANVLIDADGRAHLSDFGISVLGEMDTGTTTANAFSPPYAAPERLEGRVDIDPTRSDIYSLAATAWAAIVGGAPFGTTTSGGVSGLIHRVMANQLDRPTSMPPALYDVLRTGMSLDPMHRYATGSALAGAARDALDHTERGQSGSPHQAVVVRPHPTDGSGFSGGADSSGFGGLEIEPADEEPPSRPSRRALAMAGVILLALVAAGGAALVSSKSDSVATGSTRSTTSTEPSTSVTTPGVGPQLCSITNGRADLTPGILWGEMTPQDVTMTAPVSCTTTGGSTVDGNLIFTASFPQLGFEGGTAGGSGAIDWTDGTSTEVQGSATVLPPDEVGYAIVLDLEFTEGFGAPASGTTAGMKVVPEFDPGTNRVVQITGMSGALSWEQ